MTRPFVRVLKVGGSLLQWQRLPQALQQWLDRQPLAANVLLCGGGRFADMIREADHRFSLGEEHAHWLAVECLSVTARLLAAVCHQELITSLAMLEAAIENRDRHSLVFDPGEFLRVTEAETKKSPLPHSWLVTSDSIAARLAESIHADELVLLKSTDQPAGTLTDLAAKGYVDGHFPTACRQLAPPRFVNLRASS